MHQFRHFKGYKPEFYISYGIPASENPNLIPFAAYEHDRDANGDYRMDAQVGYALGDIDFAKQTAKNTIGHHPTWSATVRRLNTGAVVAEVKL